MIEIPSPIDVESWPQAVVTIVLIVAVVIVPAVLAYRTKLATQRVRREVAQVQTTLTQNNGGNSVKDRFDHLDRTLADHLARSEKWEKDILRRVTALEQPKGWFGHRTRSNRPNRERHA